MTYWPFLLIALACAVAAVGLHHLTDGGMRDGALAALGIFGAVLCLVGACVSVGAFTSFTIDRRACMEQGARTGMYVQYEPLSGCYVDVDDHLVPYDRWVQVSGVNTP